MEREVEEEEVPVPQEVQDEVPRGWRPSPEIIGAVERPGEAPSTAQDYPVQGDASDTQRLASGFDALQSTETGRPVADAIRDHGATVQFGVPDNGAIAAFEPNTNEITLHEDLRDASPAVLAAHLAHEGSHVQWDQPGNPGSIDEEYHAFKAEHEVWQSLKGEESDDQCDRVSDIVAGGEADAKDEIRRMYPHLPEYWRPS